MDNLFNALSQLTPNEQEILNNILSHPNDETVIQLFSSILDNALNANNNYNLNHTQYIQNINPMIPISQPLALTLPFIQLPNLNMNNNNCYNNYINSQQKTETIQTNNNNNNQTNQFVYNSNGDIIGAFQKQMVANTKSNDTKQAPKDENKNAKGTKTITQHTMKRGRHISSKEKPHVCTVCGKGYKYLCNFRSHQKIHTDDALVCAYCNKRFGRMSNYKEHVRIHTGEAPYACTFCAKRFKQHHAWKDHLRTHTGEKPYLCKVCGKRFTVGHNLNVHMRIHTGERPFKCCICNKSYRQKSAYNSHIKSIHGAVIQSKRTKTTGSVNK